MQVARGLGFLPDAPASSKAAKAKVPAVSREEAQGNAPALVRERRLTVPLDVMPGLTVLRSGFITYAGLPTALLLTCCNFHGACTDAAVFCACA